MQVLQPLPWEEHPDEALSNLFVGKKVVACTLYQNEKCSAPSIEAVMEMEGGSVYLRAVAILEHSVFHAFLSDEQGRVVEGIPLDMAISSVCRVKRVENDREWWWAGHPIHGGCVVTGIQFGFGTGASLIKVVLHCWEQCQPVPFCGDPHTPEYRQWSVSQLCSEAEIFGRLEELFGRLGRDCAEAGQDPLSEVTRIQQMDDKRSGSKTVQEGKEVTFLPGDFVGSIGSGLWLFDASGMHSLRSLNIQSSGRRALRIGRKSSALSRSDALELVKANLGFGQWDKDNVPLLKIRKQGVQEGPMLLKAKGSGFTAGILDLRKLAAEVSPSMLLFGAYTSVEEFLSLPEKFLRSRELNAVLDGQSLTEAQGLAFPTNEAHALLHLAIKQIKDNSEQLGTAAQQRSNRNNAMKFSVRFTLGRSFPFSTPLDSRVLARESTARFKSDVEIGCKGASLGYHLTTSSECRNVITLHGSLENLLADLTEQFGQYRSEIDENRSRIGTGQIQYVLGAANRLGLRDSSFEAAADDEVMSLRICNPQPEAALACAQVLDGRIPYDARNHCALYPVQTTLQGNLKLAAACAVIIEVLINLKQRLAQGETLAPSSGRTGVLQFESI